MIFFPHSNSNDVECGLNAINSVENVRIAMMWLTLSCQMILRHCSWFLNFLNGTKKWNILWNRCLFFCPMIISSFQCSRKIAETIFFISLCEFRIQFEHFCTKPSPSIQIAGEFVYCVLFIISQYMPTHKARRCFVINAIRSIGQFTSKLFYM